MAVSEDLQLNLRPALASLSKLDEAFNKAATGFEKDITKAIHQATSKPVVVTIRAEPKGIKSSIENAVAGASKNVTLNAEPAGIKPAIENAIAGANKNVTVTADTSQLRAATAETHGFGVGLGAVAGGAALVGAALGAAGVASVGFGVKLAGNLEQARIGFTSMLGSAEAADAMLATMRDFANKSPFEFPDVVTGGRRLLAMGFAAQDVIPTLTDVGNAVAAMGGDAEMIQRVTTALGQMQAKGKVSAEEMLQLTEAGIPAWDMLAQAMGKSVGEVQDMVTAGNVSAEVFQAAFHTGVVERFGNAMEAQSKTFLGLWSTFKDVVSTALTDISTPLIESLKTALPDLQNAVVGIMKSLGPAVGPVLGGLATTIANVFNAIGPTLGLAIAQIGPILDRLQPAILAFGEFFTAAQPGIEALGRVGATVFGALGDAFVEMAPSLAILTNLLARVAEILGKAFAKVLERVAPVLARVAERVLPVFAKALEKMAPAIEKFAEAMAEVGAAQMEALGDVMIELLPVIPPLTDALVLLLPPLIQLMRLQLMVMFVLPLKALALALQGVTAAINEGIVPAFNWVRDNAGPIWESVKAGVMAAVDWIKGAFNDVVGFITGVPQRMVDGLGDLGGTIWAAITGGFDTLKTNLSNVANTAKDIVVGAFNAMRDGVSDAMGVLRGAVEGAWNGIKSAIGNVLRPIGSAIKGFLGAIATIADAVGMGWLGGPLRDVANGAGAWGAGLAAGGQVPIVDRRSPPWITRGPAAVVGEGRPQHPEYVIPTDPQYRGRAMTLTTRLMRDIGMLAQGGTIPMGSLRSVPGYWGGGVLDAIKDVGGAITDVGGWLLKQSVNVLKFAAPGWVVDMFGDFFTFLRRVAAGALETMWPRLDMEPGLLGIFPSGVNTVRGTVLDLIRGEADRKSEEYDKDLAGQLREEARRQRQERAAGNTFQRLIPLIVAAGGSPLFQWEGGDVSSMYRSGPHSYHGDALNPAVDIGDARLGRGFLDRLYFELVKNLPWRELIYQNNIWHGSTWSRYPGSDHFNHIHVAHSGGIVPGYPGQVVPGLLKAGERVLTMRQNARFDQAVDRLLEMSREPAGANIGPFYVSGPNLTATDLAREIAWRQRFG